MTAKDIEILAKTKEDVEKEVRAKFNIKRIRKVLAFNLNVLDQDRFVSDYIEDIKKSKKNAAKKIGVPDSLIKISHNWNWNSYEIQFHANREETDTEFEKRIKINLSRKWSRIKRKQESIKREEDHKKRRDISEAKRKRKKAIDAIEELGDDIYEIFQEINKSRKS